MVNFVQGTQLRTMQLGTRVSKATGTLAATTVSLFTVAGGECLITAMYGLVTVSVTVANTYYLQLTPTTGQAAQLCTSLDIGTTDTTAGGLLTFGLATATLPPKLMSPSTAAGGYGAPLEAVVTTGIIQSVSAGTDGNITWVLTYVPLTDGATIVAA
jgi:hypothetical protein